jgi:hypothetical protein
VKIWNWYTGVFTEKRMVLNRHEKESFMSSDKMDYTVRIFLTNGEKLCFKNEVGNEEVYNLGSRIEKSLEANYMGLDMNGKLTIIPSQQILKIEIEPTPEVLVAHVVRNIEALEE